MLTKADIYLHNPKGSNNRLAEQSVARANNQRLFNSQNNNNGGYNTGSVYYYTGSKLQVEWTSQHSCQHPNNNCEFILQYMCHDLIRDGKSVNTIPSVNSDKNFQFGMHENWRHYKNCLMRERNRGLFIADQNLKKNQATHTRQNPGGTRYGYECAEEKDYYPYWHPSPWKDIAVLTNNASRCLYYQQESQNNKSKWACTLNENDFADLSKNLKVVLPNNKEECEKFCFPEKSPNCKKSTWKEFPAHGLPPPECRENEYSEDNYLGNGPSGNAIRYNWTLPEIPGDNCVFRIRYNISTNDFSWDTDHKFNAPKPGTATKVDLSQEYFLNNTAKIRGYEFKQNPEVKIFKGVDFGLRLAINTAQFGRTFQDRTHTFSIKKRPQHLNNSVIHNLNVRGKRGNIVQVYPAVEYDFVPNTLEIATGEFIHFQWNGSNTNNKNFEGEGTPGTDRNNVLMLSELTNSSGEELKSFELSYFGHYVNSYPAPLTNITFLNLTKDDLIKLASSGSTNQPDPLLNKASTYFDLQPRKITQSGIYHYLCTRNNNFSNRNQKGKIVVSKFPTQYKAIGQMGGSLQIKDKAELLIAAHALENLVNLQMEFWPIEKGIYYLKQLGKSLPKNDGFSSDFFLVRPEEDFSADKKAKLSIKLTNSDKRTVSMYRSENSPGGVWQKVPVNIKDGMAIVMINRGGLYVAAYASNNSLILGLVISLVFIIILIVGVAAFLCRSKIKNACSQRI